MSITLAASRLVAISLLTTSFLAPLSCRAETPADILRPIATTYGIEIRTDPTFPVPTFHGPITGSPAAATDLAEYVPLFAAEFTRYPKALITRAGLKRIVLCGDLSFAGQRRNAIPDFEHDTLYLDVKRGSYSQPYLRKVIHHEFFHIIDLKDDGVLYGDPRWSSLNPPEFRYGTGGRNAQDLAETSVLTTRFPGFLNHYATTAVEEDKAELFANMLVEPAYVADREKSDWTLKSKVERMKELMKGFCPEVDGAFWGKATNTHSKHPRAGGPQTEPQKSCGIGSPAWPRKMGRLF